MRRAEKFQAMTDNEYKEKVKEINEEFGMEVNLSKLFEENY